MPEVHFPKDFTSEFKLDWNFVSLSSRASHPNSNKVIARNFAHDTAVLSWKMQNFVVVWCPGMKLPDYTPACHPAVLSKVENSGSPNGPIMVDCWVVRVTFGWSVCMMWSEMTMKLQCRYVLFISNSTKWCEIDILSSILRIVLASHPCTCVLQRQLSQLHTLKLPKFSHFHGDFHQNWYFAHPKISFAHPELPFLAKSMILRSLWKFTGSSAAILPSRLSHFKVKNYSIRHDLATSGS